MKKIYLLLISLCLFSGSLWAQSNKPVHNMDRLMESDGITVIYLSPSMVRLAGNSSSLLDEDEALMRHIAKQISSIYIFTAESPEDVKILRKEFSYLSPKNRKGSEFENFMLIKDGKEKQTVELFGRMRGDIASCLFMRINQPENFTIIAIEGAFTRKMLEDIVHEQEKGKSAKNSSRSKR